MLTDPAKTTLKSRIISVDESLAFLQFLSPKKEHELKSKTTSMLTIFSSVNGVSYCKFVDVDNIISSPDFHNIAVCSRAVP